MAAGNNRDVTLTIRAKSEADRAFKVAADAAANYGAGIGKLESQLTKLETTDTRMATNLRSVTQELEAQTAKVATASQALSGYPARVAELRLAAAP